MIQCKHFIDRVRKGRTLHQGKLLSLRLMVLAAVTAAFAACTSHEDAPQQNAGTQPIELSAQTAQLASRGLITSSTLPDGESIGITVTDEGGADYCGTTYSNFQYKAATAAGNALNCNAFIIERFSYGLL